MKKSFWAVLMMGTCLGVAGCPFADVVAENFGYVPEPEDGWVSDFTDILTDLDDHFND